VKYFVRETKPSLNFLLRFSMMVLGRSNENNDWHVFTSVDVTNGTARVGGLENVRFRAPNQELVTVCHHHSMNSLTRRLSNVN